MNITVKKTHSKQLKQLNIGVDKSTFFLCQKHASMFVIPHSVKKTNNSFVI